MILTVRLGVRNRYPNQPDRRAQPPHAPPLSTGSPSSQHPSRSNRRKPGEGSDLALCQVLPINEGMPSPSHFPTDDQPEQAARMAPPVTPRYRRPEHLLRDVELENSRGGWGASTARAATKPEISFPRRSWVGHDACRDLGGVGEESTQEPHRAELHGET